jgi:hypothetical protein
MFAAHELLQWMPGPVRTTGVPAVLRLGCQGEKKCSGWCSLGVQRTAGPSTALPRIFLSELVALASFMRLSEKNKPQESLPATESGAPYPVAGKGP